MKKTFVAIALFVAAFCLAACNKASEKELFYDPTQEPGRISASGYPDIKNLECCVIFKAGLLQQYEGWDIVSIKLFNPVDSQSIKYAPLVYDADAGSAAPGNLLSQNTDPAEIDPDSWKSIPLDKPVTIEASKDYWAGYSVVTILDVNLLAQGGMLNFGNSRISFNDGISFQKASANFLVRIVVRDNR